MAELLQRDGSVIVEDACRALGRIERYRRDGDDATRRRVEALYSQVVGAVKTLDLDELLAHVRRVAQERFTAGFELSELRAAFVAVEEAIHRRAVARLSREDVAWGLGLATTALAQARLALGEAFVALGPIAHAPSVDLSVLFHRSAPAALREPEDLVHPV